jgi:hypothetical protein
MMAFQIEPEPSKTKPRCEKCHQIMLKQAKTSEGEPYCHHCGHVLGTSVMPAVWTCGCGETALGLTNHDERPHCNDCDVPMVCTIANPSIVRGAGIGSPDMDLGLSILMEAQGAALELGTDLLHEMDPRNIDDKLTNRPGC